MYFTSEVLYIVGTCTEFLAFEQQLSSTECKQAPALTFRQRQWKAAFLLSSPSQLGNYKFRDSHLQEVREMVTILVLGRNRKVRVGRRSQVPPYPSCSGSTPDPVLALGSHLQMFIMYESH